MTFVLAAILATLLARTALRRRLVALLHGLEDLLRRARRRLALLGEGCAQHRLYPKPEPPGAVFHQLKIAKARILFILQSL